MKFILFSILVFGLPHISWIPLKFKIEPEQIPLGLANLFFIIALTLFVSGLNSFKNRVNHLYFYKWYLALTVFSLLLSILNGYENELIALTIFKQQTLLLLLFYVPLAAIDDESDFKKYLYALLSVHIIIGFEVMRSGVLGGSSFHDGKRGSGPFSEGFTGSDIAGSYLAQVVMFLFAFLISSSLKLFQRSLIFLCGFVIIFGIYATYARGALVACGVGLFFMFPFFGFKVKNFVIVAILAFCAFIIAPDSVSTRFDDTKTESGEYDESTKGRFYYWNAAFEIVKENPLGVGVGQVRGAMEKKINKHVDPHNGFLYTVCEYGVIGLIIFVLMLFQIYYYALKIWNDPKMPEIYRTYALGVGGLVGSFITCNMFYSNFYKDLVMGTIVIHFGMLAFILAETKINEESEAL